MDNERDEQPGTWTFRAVRRDVTEFCDAAELKVRGIAKVYEVFLYDPDRRVYCCSLTPSWEMWQAGMDWEPSREMSDDEREYADEYVRDAGAGAGMVEYWDREPAGSVNFGAFDEDSYREAAERALDYYAGNPVWC